MSEQVLNLEVESSSAEIEEALEKLVSAFSAAIPESKRNRFQLGLNELVRNAYEHGNLGITSEQKSEALGKGAFEQLVLERAEKAREEAKKVIVEARVHGKRFICRIRDQGKGFDWREMIQFTDVTELHGRGVFIAKRSFDDVIYNEAGNEVTAVMLLIDEE